MLVIQINWMLVLWTFVGALCLIIVKLVMTYWLRKNGFMESSSSSMITSNHFRQPQSPPPRYSLRSAMEEINITSQLPPPDFHEALKLSKPVYTIETADFEEPPPAYHIVVRV